MQLLQGNLYLPVRGADQGKWQVHVQAAVVCVAKEADQHCELEALANWHPKLQVSVTLEGACCMASWLCAKTGEDWS